MPARRCAEGRFEIDAVRGAGCANRAPSLFTPALAARAVLVEEPLGILEHRADVRGRRRHAVLYRREERARVEAVAHEELPCALGLALRPPTEVLDDEALAVHRGLDAIAGLQGRRRRASARLREEIFVAEQVREAPRAVHPGVADGAVVRGVLRCVEVLEGDEQVGDVRGVVLGDLDETSEHEGPAREIRQQVHRVEAKPDLAPRLRGATAKRHEAPRSDAGQPGLEQGVIAVQVLEPHDLVAGPEPLRVLVVEGHVEEPEIDVVGEARRLRSQPPRVVRAEPRRALRPCEIERSEAGGRGLIAHRGDAPLGVLDVGKAVHRDARLHRWRRPAAERVGRVRGSAEGAAPVEGHLHEGLRRRHGAALPAPVADDEHALVDVADDGAGEERSAGHPAGGVGAPGDEKLPAELGHGLVEHGARRSGARDVGPQRDVGEQALRRGDVEVEVREDADGEPAPSLVLERAAENARAHRLQRLHQAFT